MVQSHPLSFSPLCTVMTGSLVHRGLAEFLEAFVHFRAMEYTLLAGCTLWAYDILLTVDEELTLLWSRKGGILLKAIYILVGPHLGSLIMSDYDCRIGIYPF